MLRGCLLLSVALPGPVLLPIRQQNEALQASLSQRECEVDALQQEVERLMGLDRAADPSEESRRLEQAMEIKQLRDQVRGRA